MIQWSKSCHFDMLFWEIPSKIPFGPSITSEHIFGEGRHVIIKSTFSANSFGDFAVSDPLEIKSFTRLSSNSITINLLENWDLNDVSGEWEFMTNERRILDYCRTLSFY